MRDFEGFRETRRTFLVKDSSSKEVWSSYAIACFLAGDFDTTVQTIDTLLKFNDEDKLVKKQLLPAV